MKRRAFTLIELLVVISIIGLLSTIAVVATNGARANSRNTKRLADARQLITAFNLYYNINGVYPDTSTSLNGLACVSTACTNGWAYTANATVDAAIFPTYMGAKPTDPVDGSRPGVGYMYCNGPPCNAWTIGATGIAAGTSLWYSFEGNHPCTYGLLNGATPAYTSCVVSLEAKY